jgi:hypothetical protein
MKTLILGLAATSALTLAAGAASAQIWMPIDARQDRLEARIDAGVRNGDLTRNEARQLRAEFNALAALEDDYRADGLSWSERRDLDRRFDALSARIRYARNDVDAGYGDHRWWSDYRAPGLTLEQRKMRLDRAIDQGVRSGQLSRFEASRLRAQFDAIARVEYRYRVNGLSRWEAADLNRRLDNLAYEVRAERSDGERVYGYNEYPPY